jgi:tRNA threonylcarbamoyladenosine biosynthesis protein TsaE
MLSKSPEETRHLGKRLGATVSAGDVVALTGDLGSGKSVFARGTLEALGVEGDMPSPSFVIVASYEAAIRVDHVDLYRLADAEEALDMGLDEILYSDSVSIVEWADRLGGFLPPRSIRVQIESGEEPGHRFITIRAEAPELKAALMGLAGSLIRFGGR